MADFDFTVRNNTDNGLVYNYKVRASEISKIPNESTTVKFELYVKLSGGTKNLMNEGSYLVYGMHLTSNSGQSFLIGPTAKEENYQPQMSTTSYVSLCEYTYTFNYETSCTVTIQPIVWFNNKTNISSLDYLNDGAQFNSRPTPVISSNMINSSTSYINKSFNLALTTFSSTNPEVATPLSTNSNWTSATELTGETTESDFVAQFLSNRNGSTEHAYAPIYATGNNGVQLKVKGNSPYKIRPAKVLANKQYETINIDFRRHMGLVIRSRNDVSEDFTVFNDVWDSFFVPRCRLEASHQQTIKVDDVVIGTYDHYIAVGGLSISQDIGIAMNDNSGTLDIFNISNKQLKIEIYCY